MISHYVLSGWQSIRRNRVRSFLAVFSATMVAATLALTSCLEQGLGQRSQNLADDAPRGSYRLVAGGSSEVPSSAINVLNPEKNKNITDLAYSHGAKLEVGVDENKLSVDTYITQGGYFELNSYKVENGELYSPGSSSRAAVVGNGLALRLFDGETRAVGRAITVGGSDFTVIGVLAEAQIVDIDQDKGANDAMFVSASAMDELDAISLGSARDIIVSVGENTNINSVANQIQKTSPGLSVELLPLGDPGSYPIDHDLQIKIDIVKLAAPVGMVLSALSGAAVMLSIVASRGREIGVRKSVGASSRDIFKQHIIEPVQLGIVASVVTFILVFVCVSVGDRYYDLPLSMDWTKTLQVCLAILVLSFVAGLYPAWSAARRNVSTALRMG